MTNPVPGLCPCCKDPNNSVFMQSIHSEGLFKMLLKRGDFKRDYLFCNKCIDWAKSEVLRLREKPTQNHPQYSPISEAGASRYTPDPFNDAMVDPMNDPMIMEADKMVGQLIGQRLANPTHSPLHLGNPMSPVNYMPLTYDSPMFNRTQHIIAPLPSPLNSNDVANPWEMNDDQKSNDTKDHIDL